MFFGSQILIFYAVGLQIRQNISFAVSLQFCSNKTNVPADLHELLSAAKNLPEYNIRIFNPITSYFLINRYESRIKDPDIFCCRIANPTEQ